MGKNEHKIGASLTQLLKTKAIKKPRNRLSNEPLTKEEVKLLIDSCTDLETRTLFVLGFNTGMRVSEITRIPWTSINWEEGFITIWDEKKNRYRNVTPNLSALNMLKLWHGANGGQQEYVFSFSPKTVQNRIQHWTSRVLGKKKSWHCVRHSYVTLNVIAGTPVPVVCDNTGDAPSTIYQYYTQIPPQQKREFIERGAVYEG